MHYITTNPKQILHFGAVNKREQMANLTMMYKKVDLTTLLKAAMSMRRTSSVNIYRVLKTLGSRDQGS